jgi:hypothetical protein
MAQLAEASGLKPGSWRFDSSLGHSARQTNRQISRRRDMFVKIVREINGKGVTDSKGGPVLVVPRKVTLFEADKVDYKKVTKQQGEHPGAFPIRVLGPEPGTGDEVLVVRLDDELTVMATGCSLFIMNDAGRTIDSIVCPPVGQPTEVVGYNTDGQHN